MLEFFVLLVGVIPAYAGVDPQKRSAPASASGDPRVRGGRPTWLTVRDGRVR